MRTQLYLKSRLVMLISLLLFCTITANAQFLRTSYFMEGNQYRMQLNPALMPTRGYINVPVAGALNVAVNSNTMGVNDVIDIFKDNTDFLHNQTFLNKLNDKNNINMTLNSDIISFGWYDKDKSFWSFNIGEKVDFGATVRKSMFTFLDEVTQDNYEFNGAKKYAIEDQTLNMNAFTEVGLGYSRKINDLLTVGGKAKLLLGNARAKMTIQNIDADYNLPKDYNTITPLTKDLYHAKLNVNSTLEANAEGLEWEESTNSDGQYISGVNYNQPGLAGYGAALDLGAVLNLGNLSLSAAIVDLGFINWTSSSCKDATSTVAVDFEGRDYEYSQDGVNKLKSDIQDYENRIKSENILNSDLLGLRKSTNTQARKTQLNMTAVGGASYTLGNSLTLGALYTARFVEPKTQDEVTVSANLHPTNWFNLAVSYSAIQSYGKSFGLGIKLGLLFVGTDYMYFGDNSKAVNAYLGLSIPIGRSKNSEN
jgi:hypothetical protein